jgi:protein-L-isoaspartate(D-aspartate) O-methyltransferase
MTSKRLNTVFRIAAVLMFLSGFSPIQFACAQNTEDFYRQRLNMVSQQIQERGITNTEVLEAMEKVPRHRFVLPEYIRFAYQDTPLLLTDGQTISQPYIVAFMTDALNLKPSDKVLEIGTGSGYQAAVLAEICDSVFTIEIFESLGERANTIFKSLGYNNIKCKVGDGYKGWTEHSPFNVIVVTCSPTHVPVALKEQLAEGGRMIIPVEESSVQYLILLKKRHGKIREEKVLPVRFVPMINKRKEKY